MNEGQEKLDVGRTHHLRESPAMPRACDNAMKTPKRSQEKIDADSDTDSDPEKTMDSNNGANGD